MLVVLLTVVVGLIALGAYGKYTIRRAEEAEARTELERIAALAIKVHRETGRICPSASGAVPVMMPVPSHYQTRGDEWTVDRERNAGFACLGFDRAAPQYYQYRYEATENTFTATASSQLRVDGPERVLVVKGAIVDGQLVVVEPP